MDSSRLLVSTVFRWEVRAHTIWMQSKISSNEKEVIKYCVRTETFKGLLASIFFFFPAAERRGPDPAVVFMHVILLNEWKENCLGRA